MEKMEIAQTPPPLTKESITEDKESPVDPRFEQSKPLLDLEGQNEGQQEPLQQRPTEPAASSLKTFLYLATYFLINLSLTFYNKAVMGSVSRIDERDTTPTNGIRSFRFRGSLQRSIPEALLSGAPSSSCSANSR